MIEITERDFSIEDIVKGAKRPDAGAVVTFLGIVRDDGIAGLELEAYREAAVSELERIRDEAVSRFDLRSVDIIHRVGPLGVGEDIALIVCSAGHRKEAFEGCAYILEELKARVPIWKKEMGKGGGKVGEAVTEFVMVLCTAPLGGAKSIARALVAERLAACVNVAPVRSYFTWKGELAEEAEELMIIKTQASMVEPLKSRIKELHSYQVPEIIVLGIAEGYQPYLDWIAESVG